jgi:hypothetical protein
MSKCIICHTNEATIPDRNTMSSRKKICPECHSNRLKNDLIDIMIIEKRRMEKARGGEMSAVDMISKLKSVQTIQELDSLRLETARCMKELGQDRFREVQKEFIKTKNRLLRIPLSKRSW